MKRTMIFTIAIVSVAQLSACSNLPKAYQPIRNNHDAYLNSHARSKLKLPDNHPEWQFSPRFIVPDLSKQVEQNTSMKVSTLKPPHLQELS